jgi:hypothetical protein
VKLDLEALDHPAYSPNLVPSNYHVFNPFKDALRGCHFTSDEEVKETVHVWLAAQRNLFSADIQKLVERWNKCIEKHGDYVEKLYNCKVSAVVEINYKNCVRIFIDLPS